MSIPVRYVILAYCAMFLLTGCGPETIFVRPVLDTPAHHVANGNKLVERGKLDSAYREFSRAIELDPDFAAAHVGLALVEAHRGDFNLARRHLDDASDRAISEDDRTLIMDGAEVVSRMETEKK